MATLMVGDVVAADPGGSETRATVQDDTTVHRLMCTRHKTNPLRGERSVWCVHMQRLITSGADAKQIDVIVDPVAVTVPLVPTENVWASVTIEGMHHAGMHEVALHLTDGLVAHIGVLAPHEGRNTIRLILWDFLKHAFETVGPCSASIHKTERFAPTWDKPYGEPDTQDVIDTFSILTTGYCTACAPYTDFTDDIPEL